MRTMSRLADLYSWRSTRTKLWYVFFLSLVFNLLFWHSFILTDCTSSRKIPFYSVSPNILLRLLHPSLFFLSLDIVVDTDRYMYRCMYMCVNIYTCIFYIYISLIIFSEIFKSSFMILPLVSIFYEQRLLLCNHCIVIKIRH